jgi:hypothetical protein
MSLQEDLKTTVAAIVSQHLAMGGLEIQKQIQRRS